MGKIRVGLVLDSASNVSYFYCICFCKEMGRWERWGVGWGWMLPVMYLYLHCVCICKEMGRWKRWGVGWGWMLPVMGAALLARDASHSLMHLAAAKLGKHSQIQIQIQSLPHFTIQQCLQILAGKLNRQIWKLKLSENLSYHIFNKSLNGQS